MRSGIHHSLNWSFGMSISISYSTTYSGWTVADYLADWSAYFGDVNHRPGQVVTAAIPAASTPVRSTAASTR